MSGCVDSRNRGDIRGMKKVFLNGLLGAVLAILPCYGAILSQTDWLDVPEVIAADYEWEEIPETETPWNADSVNEWLKIREETKDERSWWEEKYVNDPDIPDDIEEAAYIYGEMFNICPEFLEAICDKETGGTYRCDLKDRSGTCWGCMQINIKAQQERMADYGLTEEDMLSADGGMIVAASLVAELFETYQDPAIVLMKYNGAKTALAKYRKTGELNYYTRYVLDLAAKLQEKHQK